MIARLNDCCATCDGCGVTVCDETWPPNACAHGHAICRDCAPGNCLECAAEVHDELTDHDIPGGAA